MMALTMFPMAFKVILKTLQKFEIIHLCAKVSNTYIWILLSFSHYFRYFSQVVYKWPCSTAHGFQSELENSPNI